MQRHLFDYLLKVYSKSLKSRCFYKDVPANHYDWMPRSRILTDRASCAPHDCIQLAIAQRDVEFLSQLAEATQSKDESFVSFV